ncbi:Ig-like domain repeat protein [Streptomyces sp. NPDC001581]|uniref:Ig-like domain repeat protein n=1 Tax=Streptomyces sp. NPDC001581 TaxID=3154386 RepID=UPI00332E09C9
MTGAVFLAALLTAPGAHAQDFGASADHPVGNPARSVATGDVDGNSNPALAVAQSVEDSLSPAGTAPATTALVSSVNPSVVGQTVTFTATVTGDQGIPTGTVLFKDGDTNLGPDALDATGTASLPISDLAVGTHHITAVYGGNTTYAPSTSNTVDQVVSPRTCDNAVPTVIGTNRADHLVGSAGNDSLSGEAGNDRLDGGTGTNTNNGGPGRNICTNPTTGPGCST